MKMWIVQFSQRGSNSFYYEYYANEQAANLRAEYFESCGYDACAYEKELMDEPKKGAPDGWYRWQGETVK